MNAARRWLAKKQGVSEAEVAPILAGVKIPDPVFFCSIETTSLVNMSYLFILTSYLIQQDYICALGLSKEIGTCFGNASTRISKSESKI
jgi:hypothetical protein